MSPKVNVLKVQDFDIVIESSDSNDYICITDIAKSKDVASRAADIIKKLASKQNNVGISGDMGATI